MPEHTLDPDAKAAFVAWLEAMRDETASAIRRYRKERGMTTLDLANALKADHGVDISRSTLAKMESGERSAFTVPDLIALAYALGVSPMSLVIPTGRSETLELLPGSPVEVDLARRWFVGEARLGRAFPAEYERLERARQHDQAVRRLRQAGVREGDHASDLDQLRQEEQQAEDRMHEAQAALNESDEESDSEKYLVLARLADDAQASFEEAQRERIRAATARNEGSRLRSLRRRMREVGDIPPPLPEELAWVEEAGDAS